MKKLLLLAATATVAGLTSCQKETTQINVLPQPTVSAFRVTGVTDLSIKKTPFGMYPYWQMPLNVVYGNGEPQRVTLKLSNIPQGIKDSLTQKAGYPDFSSTAIFFYQNAVNGDHKVSLEAIPDSGKTLTYSFTISVSGDTSCTGYFLARNLLGYSSCMSSTPGYAVNFNQSGTSGDTLVLNNFDNANNGVRMVINCNNQSITIPAQSIQGFYYTGNAYLYTGGSSGGTAISMTLTKYDASGNYINYCSYNFQ